MNLEDRLQLKNKAKVSLDILQNIKFSKYLINCYLYDHTKKQVLSVLKQFKTYYKEQNIATSLYDFLDITESQYSLINKTENGIWLCRRVIMLNDHADKTKNITLVDGLPYRTRRGKLVAIPIEWYLSVPYPNNIKKRNSKFPRKQIRNRAKGH